MFPVSGTLNNHEITIQLLLDGFSFLISTRPSHETVLVETHNSPSVTLLDAMTLIENTYSCSISDFGMVTVLFDNSRCTLVPSPIFQNQAKGRYLDFLGIRKEKQVPAVDHIALAEAENVYPVNEDDAKTLTEIQCETRFRHASTVRMTSLIKDSVNRSKDTMVYVNVKSPEFDITVMKGRSIILHNTFGFKTKEDFIYFLLFTIDQLHLDTEAVPLYFMGMIEEKSALVELTSRYIRDVRFVRNFKDYTLINSTTCE